MESVEKPSSEPAAEQEPRAAGRWFRRVLPVTALAVLLVALAALAVPSVRDQVKLSLSRQSQPYVELYFARQNGPVAQAVCLRRGGKVGTRFTIASHLDNAQAVAYRVTMATKKSSVTKHGSAHTFPGKAVQVGEAFALPKHTGYTLTVTLPALDQQLRAHCGGSRR